MRWKINKRLISLLGIIILLGALGSFVEGNLNKEIIISSVDKVEMRAFAQTSGETRKIIEKHRNDFDSTNVKAYLNSHGGYVNYVKSLGGVFTKYINDGKPVTVKTYSEFYEVAEYVWGLYEIWGLDYSNGFSTNDVFFHDYSSAFYKDRNTGSRRFKVNYDEPWYANGYDLPTIDEMLGNPDRYYAVTNCGQGVKQLLMKAGLIPTSSITDPGFMPSEYVAKGHTYKLIKSSEDLKPGDIICVCTQKIPNRSGRTTIGDYCKKDDGTGIMDHVTIVVARNESNKTITLYDSGRAYNITGGYVNVKKFGDDPYGFGHADWIGIRFDFTDSLIDDTNGIWKKNDKGVWFKRADGSYPKDGWSKIQGYWYYFDKLGYVVTGLKKIDGGYYYLSEDNNHVGRMASGWQMINSKWYYFSPVKSDKLKEGEMYTGFNVINYKGNNNTYYFDNSGIMTIGWKKINNKWYYFDGEGVMKTGWLQTKEGAWYYLSQDTSTKGQMVTGWKKLNYNGKKYWFYFAKTEKEYKGFKEGQMLTGRQLVEYEGKYNYYYFCETTGTPSGYVKGAMIANAEYKGMKYDASGAYVDEVAPKAEISYSTKEPTSKNVVVTIKANEPIQGLAEWKLSEDKLTLTKEYKENKAEKLTIKDLAGNSTIAKIEVNNIDNKGPEIKVSYSETELTNKGVIVTLKSNEKVNMIDGWMLNKEELELTKEYKTNVKEEIEVSDKLNNKSRVIIEITNIYETKLETTKYTVDEDMIVIKNIGETVKDFKENNTVTARSIKILNTSGQEMKEGELIGTGCKIVLDDTLTYRIVVQGDYDGDGIASVKDMAITQRALLQSIDLEDIHLRALDMNESGRIEVSDLARICRIVKGE